MERKWRWDINDLTRDVWLARFLAGGKVAGWEEVIVGEGWLGLWGLVGLSGCGGGCGGSGGGVIFYEIFFI